MTSFSELSNTQQHIIRKGRKESKRNYIESNHIEGNSSDSSSEDNFKPCKYDNRYLIAHDSSSQLKYSFRLKDSPEEIISPYINEDGVACVDFGKEVFLHVIVSQQMYGDSKSNTKLSKRAYEWTKELPENAYVIGELDGVDLNDRYYFDPDSETFFLKTPRGEVKYKTVLPNINGTRKYFSLMDINGNYHSFNYYKIILELRDRN